MVQTKPATATPPPALQSPRPMPSALLGVLLGLLLATGGSGIVFMIGYSKGKRAGAEEALAEAERREVNDPLAEMAPDALPTEPVQSITANNPSGAGMTSKEAPAPTQAGPASQVASPEGRDLWVFSAADCAGVVWPMEIVPHAEQEEGLMLRYRQGANRLARRGMAVADFVFAMRNRTMIHVYARVRYDDACANALMCRINGGNIAPFTCRNDYGRWVWDRCRRHFVVGDGLHRLTLEPTEDGMEIDRIVLSSRPLPTAYLESLARTPPPPVASMPPQHPELDPIRPFSAQAFADHSLVIGAGHKNTVGIYLRRNDGAACSGLVSILSGPGRYQSLHEFSLSPEQPSELLSIPLRFSMGAEVSVPLLVDVRVDGQSIHQQRLDFIRPLAWAFLGPLSDPEGKGLDAEPPPGFDPQTVHQFGARDSLMPDCGVPWRLIDDGSCYDEFGVVDLNRVFGYPNEPWRHASQGISPLVGYAVTMVRTPRSNHECIALAGDDCVMAWMNGDMILRTEVNAPMETQRQVLGLKTEGRGECFVFKVPQQGYYWQLLLEPDESTPYGRHNRMRVMPFEQWRQRRDKVRMFLH
jgi:hypothetical protein